MPLEDAALQALMEQVSRRILEKLEKGKKLSTEDILLLYLDLAHRDVVETRRELREEIRMLASRIDEANRRIDQVNARIDAVHGRLEEQRREPVSYTHLTLPTKA